MTRREVAAERHASTASSGADSWKSTDTIKGPFAVPPQRRGTPVRITTDKEQRYVLPTLSATSIKAVLHPFASAIVEIAIILREFAVMFDAKYGSVASNSSFGPPIVISWTASGRTRNGIENRRLPCPSLQLQVRASPSISRLAAAASRLSLMSDIMGQRTISANEIMQRR